MTNKITVKLTVSQPDSAKITRKGLEAIRRFDLAKTIIAAQERIKDAAEAEIRAELGSAELGIHHGIPVVKVVHSRNTSVDQAKLREEFPDAAAATLRTTPYTYLKAML